MKYVSSEEAKEFIGSVTRDEVEIEPLCTSGEALDAGYKLLEGTFDAEALDPKSSYVQRLSAPVEMNLDYLPCYAIAVVVRGDVKVVVGIISSDVMWLPDIPASSFLAIGNLTVDESVRRFGVGTALYSEVRGSAAKIAASQQRQLLLVVLESEDRSISFWDRLGFRQPRDVKYWQPPLEWDEEGTPIHAEVPETLLFAMEGGPSTSSIASQSVESVVRTIYENWSLRDYRSELTASAMARAQSYVMEGLLDRVLASLPGGDIPLIAPSRAASSS